VIVVIAMQGVLRVRKAAWGRVDAAMCFSTGQCAPIWLNRPGQPCVVSPLGYGIRSLTLFGKPLMADDTEIGVFTSSIQ
jgi:hypothetical protein